MLKRFIITSSLLSTSPFSCFLIRGHNSNTFTQIGKFLKLNLDENILYSIRNLEKTIRFSLKSERFHWPEKSQIKAEISLRTNVKLIFYRNVGWQGHQWIP